MPLIPAPNDEPFEPEPIPQEELSEQEEFWRNRRVAIYMDVPSWKCPECGCVVFGRCEECVYCKIKLGKITSRPAGEGYEKLQVKDEKHETASISGSSHDSESSGT